MSNCKESTFVGVDISKSFFDVCFLDAKGKFVQQRINQNPKGYRQLAGAIREDAVCVMEATSTYHLPLALWLYNHGIQVVVENPLKIKRFSQMHLQRHKTDKADAKIIYEYGTTIVTQKVTLWQPQPVEIQELQQCDSLSQHLNKELTAITNTHDVFCNLKIPTFANKNPQLKVGNF